MSSEEEIQQVPDEVTAAKVVEHHLDEEAGVYTLVVANETVIPAHTVEEPVLDEDGMPTDEVVEVYIEEQLVGHTDVMDYVFDANDSRWFDARGERLPPEAIASMQKQDVKAAREASEYANQQSPVLTPLPGVGSAL